MDFLKETLRGRVPDCQQGDTPFGRWQWRGEGVMTFTPLQPTEKALIISAGLHGNETAPVEIVARLMDSIIAGQLAVDWHLLVILGNPAALREQKRYLHSDINRMFGGRWRQFTASVETANAQRLEQAVGQFIHDTRPSLCWHLDMHTAIRDSLYPRFGVLPLRPAGYDEAFLAWLGGAGLQALVFHQQPAGTFSHFTSEAFNALSCTLELGKALPFGENRLEDFLVTGQALCALLQGDRQPFTGNVPYRYRVTQQITRLTDQFILHLSDKVSNFTPFNRGRLLAQDGDIRYTVKADCEYILFPNPNVAPGLRAGLMLEKLPL